MDISLFWFVLFVALVLVLTFRGYPLLDKYRERMGARAKALDRRVEDLARLRGQLAKLEERPDISPEGRELIKVVQDLAQAVQVLVFEARSDNARRWV